MAYHCLHTNSFSGYTEALGFISTSLQTIGWELHDDVSSTDKVFTSTGEDNNFVNAYIRIYISTYLRFDGYMWWDNSTHTGVGKAYSSSSYNYINITDNRSLIVYGDKDEIVIWHAGSSANYMTKSFGFITPNISGYTTASGISSGSNIIVDVDSTDNLLEGADLMVIGSSTEGRDKVELKEIISDTQIKLTSTPRAYASGAKIGHFPCPFYCTLYQPNVNSSYFMYVCGFSSTSTSNSTSSHRYAFDGLLHATPTALDPDDYLNKYVLQVPGIDEVSTPYNTVGYLKYIKKAPVSQTAVADYNQYLYCVGNMAFSGTPTSTLSSGIVDVGHSWTVDEFKDKIIIITSGPGLGQTRKVLSNTNDTLTIGDVWGISPDDSSSYELYDSIYRNISNDIAIKEIVS